MHSKEAFQASKLMLEFITHYVDLAQHQLLSIKEEMDGTCQTLMSQVEQISNLTDTKKQEADTIIVNDKKLLSSAECATQECNIVIKNCFQRSGGLYTKSMEAVSSLDESIQSMVLGVIGIISMDDVIRQRMDHVISSINMLHATILEIVPLIQKGLNRNDVKLIRNRLLTKTYKMYTMESEKKLFHKYFGRPIEKKAA